jgi:hypothetical protein
VLLNNTATGATSPSFGSHVDFPTPTAPRAIVAADFNGDGKPDVAVGSAQAHVISVLLNTTAANANTPSFAARVDLPLSSSPGFIAAADLDGDGKIDLITRTGATVNSFATNILINSTAQGAATPTFTRVDLPQVSTAWAATEVAAADMNGDGKPDVLLVDGIDLVLLTSVNTTTSMPSLGTVNGFAAVTGFGGMLLADVTGDGKPDALLSSLTQSGTGPGVLSVYVNDTPANATQLSFATRNDQPTSAALAPSSMAVADLDGDGKPDIAMTAHQPAAPFGGVVSVFIAK